MSRETPPVVISASTTLNYPGSAAGFAGQNAQLSPRSLSNIYHVPIEIRELRFMMRNSGAAGEFAGLAGLATRPWFGGVVQAQIAVGWENITRDFVPVGSFAPAWQGSAEVDPISPQVLGNVVGRNHFRWILPRPIVLLPGAGFRAVVRLDPMNMILAVGPVVDAFAITVTVGAVGRYLAPDEAIPDTTPMPYASAFVGAPAGVANGPASNHQHFNNPFAVPLTVQRFIGRCNEVGLKGVDSITDEFESAVLVTMRSAGGYSLTPEPIEPWRLFDRQTRALDVPHVITGPHSWHKIEFSGLSNSAWPIVSMIGHREVAL